MVSAIETLRREVTFEGQVIPCGELHMVGTLPEARGGGAITRLMEVILEDYRGRGDLFALLIPFSFAFYRRYGFEVASEMLSQKVPIDQFAGFRQELTARQILSQEDADRARELYGRFVRGYNLGDVKTPQDWICRENREVGQRDFQYLDRTHYSYLFPG